MLSQEPFGLSPDAIGDLTMRQVHTLLTKPEDLSPMGTIEVKPGGPSLKDQLSELKEAIGSAKAAKMDWLEAAYG